MDHDLEVICYFDFRMGRLSMVDFLNQISDAVGLCGDGCLLTAYFLLSTNRISSQSFKYQLLNFFGALLILFSLLFSFNLASFVIEIIWMAISLMGIYRIARG